MKDNTVRVPLSLPDPEPAAPTAADTPQVRALLALNRVAGSRMYEGTAPWAEVAKRRAHNKRARAARRTQRRSR